MDFKDSGLAGLLGIVGLAVLYLVLRNFFPSLASILLVIVGIIIVLILLLVVFVIVLAFNQPMNGTGDGAVIGIDGDSAAMLSSARSDLMEIRRTMTRIKNRQINETGSAICTLIEKILKTLKEKPKQIPKSRQFLTYYLPTIRTIFEKYLRIESSGIDADKTTEDTVKYLSDIRDAMEKLYEKLFDDDILDLSVEMEVMKLVCESDGLLPEFDTTPHDGDDKAK
nr:5-bromo-4-chloroindolyl phosphate hydrolysis family protein [Clostridia bacterium]